MNDYIIKYIESVANELEINISEFYENINKKYELEYGVNIKLEAENNNMDMIDYCIHLGKGIDDSFLFRLVSMANKIKREANI